MRHSVSDFSATAKTSKKGDETSQFQSEMYEIPIVCGRRCARLFPDQIQLQY